MNITQHDRSESYLAELEEVDAYRRRLAEEMKRLQDENAALKSALAAAQAAQPACRFINPGDRLINPANIVEINPGCVNGREHLMLLYVDGSRRMYQEGTPEYWRLVAWLETQQLKLTEEV